MASSLIGFSGSPQTESEAGVAHGDGGLVVELGVAGGGAQLLTFDRGPVRGAKVAGVPAAFVLEDLEMLAGDPGVGDGDVR